MFEDASGTASGNEFVCTTPGMQLSKCCPSVQNPITLQRVCDCTGQTSDNPAYTISVNCVKRDVDECAQVCTFFVLKFRPMRLTPHLYFLIFCNFLSCNNCACAFFSWNRVDSATPTPFARTWTERSCRGHTTANVLLECSAMGCNGVISTYLLPL